MGTPPWELAGSASTRREFKAPAFMDAYKGARWEAGQLPMRANGRLRTLARKAMPSPGVHFGDLHGGEHAGRQILTRL